MTHACGPKRLHRGRPSGRRHAWGLSFLTAFSVASISHTAIAQGSAPRRVLAPHVVVELVADQLPDITSRDVWLGLRFELEQDWHIYWRNPGDSGAPPLALWQPLPGASFGPFEWPAPERIVLGPLVNYGYTNEVVLPFRVTSRTPLVGSGPVAVRAQVRWMICKDLCIPGQAELSLPLPLRDDDRARLSVWQQQIAGARRRIPQMLPAAWQARATTTKDSVTLSIRMDRAAEHATFFPADANQIADGAPQQVVVKGRELVVTLRRSPRLTKAPTTFRGVLVLQSGPGYVIDASVSGPS